MKNACEERANRTYPPHTSPGPGARAALLTLSVRLLTHRLGACLAAKKGDRCGTNGDSLSLTSHELAQHSMAHPT